MSKDYSCAMTDLMFPTELNSIPWMGCQFITGIYSPQYFCQVVLKIRWYPFHT